MQIKKSKIINIAMLLAVIPTMLFFSWYKIGIALVATFLIIISYIKICRRNNVVYGEMCIYIEKQIVFFILVWLVFISFFAGVGGVSTIW